MTHRPALTAILNIFGNTLVGASREDKKSKDIILKGYRTRKGSIGVGVFSDVKLTSTDLKRALQLRGNAHMPLASIHKEANISLVIADGLCKTIGGTMNVKRMGRLNGLVTELPRSEQLALV